MTNSVQCMQIVFIGSGNLATNLATAEVIILALDRGDLDWREMYK